jgi:hypothetical protein
MNHARKFFGFASAGLSCFSLIWLLSAMIIPARRRTRATKQKQIHAQVFQDGSNMGYQLVI